MIDFPQKLHQIYQFEQNGVKYAADLSLGYVVEIDTIISRILDLCESFNGVQLLEQLEIDYDKSAIRSALQKLEEFALTGMFFDGQKTQSLEMDRSERLRLFVSPGFLNTLTFRTFTSKVEYFYLLSALAKQADMEIGYPIQDENALEAEVEFDVEGIKKIPFKKDRIFSPAKYIPETCNGILTLSSVSYEELPFSNINQPVIHRICSNQFTRSGEIGKDVQIQSFLEMSFVLRNFDALCADSSWTRDAFNRVCETKDVHVISNGVNHDLFSPLNKQAAKINVAQALDNHEFYHKPIVLIISGFSPEEGVPLLTKLAIQNQGMAFLILDEMMRDYMKDKPGNIEFYPISDAKDIDALSIIFNAVSLAFFPTVLGVLSSHVLSAMACGVPMIVAGAEKMPFEVGNAGIFIKTDWDAYGKLNIPVEALSEQLLFLIDHEAERQQLGANAQKKAASHTWEATAQKLIELFRALREQQYSKEQSHRHFPLKFMRSYDKSDGSVVSLARQLPSFRKLPVHDAIVATLLQDHTQKEVLAVLNHFCKDPERAEHILERVLNSDFRY